MSPAMSWADRIKTASEATTGGFEDLEANKVYNFIIPDEARVSEKDGFPRYSVFLRVEDGPRKNARMWHNFYTSAKPNGMRMFFDQMAVLGLTEDGFFARNPSDADIAKALIGKRFSAETYEDSYNGKKSIKLRKFSPAIGSGIGPGVASAPAAAAPAQGFAAPAVQQAPMQGFAAQPVVQQAPAQQDPWQAPVAPQAPAQGSTDPWANAGLQAPPLV